jgi:hypothetical protein
VAGRLRSGLEHPQGGTEVLSVSLGGSPEVVGGPSSLSFQGKFVFQIVYSEIDAVIVWFVLDLVVVGAVQREPGTQ